jgi:GH43 family beta-xylosidase
MVIRNPVYAGYLADPFVFRHDGDYYAIGTGPASDGLEFPMLRSSDFTHWEPIGFALERPQVDGDCFWAPEIAFHEGRFFLYYSVGKADKGHHLRAAISQNPYGPYRDSGRPLLDPESTPFAIDASPFRDVDGRWYLFYSRDFLECGNDGRSGTALVVAPMTDMLHLSTKYAVVMRAQHDWQRFQANRIIYGGTYDWHTLEGPFTIRHAGRYYCFYSGGNWQNDTYGVDWVEANHPMGPYKDTNRGNGPRLLTSVPGHVIGPGHNSIVSGPTGDSSYIAYHAWDKGMTARRLYLDLLEWTEEGPFCYGPTFEGTHGRL